MWKTLAKLLGVPERAAEDAVKSERLAREVLTRRQALSGLGALVSGTAFGFGTALEAAQVNPILTGCGGAGFEVGDKIYIDHETALPGVGRVRPGIPGSWTITGVNEKGEFTLQYLAHFRPEQEPIKWMIDLRSNE